MADHGSIPAWSRDQPGTPRTSIPGWNANVPGVSRDPATREIGARIAEAAHLYRAHLRPVVGLALMFQGILSIPLAIQAIASIQRLVQFWSEMFSGTPRPDWAAMAAWDVGPFHDLPLDQGLMGLMVGLSTLGGLLSMAAIAMLVVRPASAGEGVVAIARTTLRHGRRILLLGLDLTLVLGAFYWAQAVWLMRVVAFDPSDPSTFAAAASGASWAVLFSLFALILEGGLVYAFVRWSVAIPALIVEELPLRSALSRSSDLTRGRRVSIFWLLTVVGIAVCLILSLVTYLPAIVALLAGWDSALVTVMLIAGLVVGVAVGAPYLAIIVAVLYRDLRDAGPRPSNAVPPVPPGWNPTAS